MNNLSQIKGNIQFLNFVVTQNCLNLVYRINVNSLCLMNLFYLIMCVVDVLNEACDGRLHQHEERELP